MSVSDAIMPTDDGGMPRPVDREFAPWDSVEWESAWDADPRCDNALPEPEWATLAHRASIREALSVMARGTVGRDALILLAELDGAQLAAEAQASDHADMRRGAKHPGTGDHGAPRVLLDGIMLAQRVINHVQAMQHQLISALCRPGVAVPLADLVDLAGTDLTEALADAVDAATDIASGTATTRPTDMSIATTTTTATPAVGSADAVEQRGEIGRDRDPAAMLAHPVWGSVIRDAAVKAATAEIGCALGLAPITARMRCEAALDLVDELPATLDSQRRGDLDGYRVKLIADRTAVLPAPLRRHVERRILPRAGVRTAAALRRIIDREVITADPDAARRRVEAAHADRHVSARRGEDDTGIFTAIIPAADSETAYRVLDTIAAQLTSAGLADGRTRDQLRADAFTDLFQSLADTGSAHLATGLGAGTGTGTDGSACACPRGDDGTADGPTGSHLPTGRPGTVVSTRRPVALNVYVNAATLARLSDEPGELAGYGAITADTARALAASADTIRTIRVQAGGGDHGGDVSLRACGSILDAGRAVYRPPDQTADYVASTYRTCAFPGCRAPAARCDLDHRIPFDADGDTCPHNLDPLCRVHHRLKTFTAWRAVRDPRTDRLTWTSALGATHAAEPAHLLHDDGPPF